MCVCVFVFLSVCVLIRTHTHTHTHMYACMYACVYVCLCTCYRLRSCTPREFRGASRGGGGRSEIRLGARRCSGGRVGTTRPIVAISIYLSKGLSKGLSIYLGGRVGTTRRAFPRTRRRRSGPRSLSILYACMHTHKHACM